LWELAVGAAKKSVIVCCFVSVLFTWSGIRRRFVTKKMGERLILNRFGINVCNSRNRNDIETKWVQKKDRIGEMSRFARFRYTVSDIPFQIYVFFKKRV
jgi:hypothetical protein